MREIKFRAWHKTGKEMFYDKVRYIFYWKEEGQPIDIMQYTGLKDKNGKEIYEGDILLFERNYNYSNGEKNFKSPVKFYNGAFTIDILRSGLEINGDYIGWGLAHEWKLGTKSLHNGEGTMEIIGNIYENPELLK